MDKPKQPLDEDIEKGKLKIQKKVNSTHLGSSNAFEETENPLSRDADNISDEKLDELLGE
jgi:hypothetical protein